MGQDLCDRSAFPLIGAKISRRNNWRWALYIHVSSLNHSNHVLVCAILTYGGAERDCAVSATQRRPAGSAPRFC
jgi:hypothetical protein